MSRLPAAVSTARWVEEATVPGTPRTLRLLCGFRLLLAGLRPLNMLFVEEPVNADTPHGLVALRRANPDQRIAAGERLCTRWAFREWLEQGAVESALGTVLSGPAAGASSRSTCSTGPPPC